MAYMSTMPGFSSRTSVHIVKQFPQRDGADMSDEKLEAGWSNSPAVEDAPEDVQPDVETPEELKPGFSNAKAVKGDAPEAQAADSDDSTDEAYPAPAKKTAAKKTAAKKKG